MAAPLDFTSSLYLGLRHGSDTLIPWRQITTGRPAALQPNSIAEQVSAELAALQGCEAALLAPSTLHLFWDLFELLARGERRLAILVDAALYPIARWGIERVAAQGVAVTEFRSHDSSDLERSLAQRLPPGARPVVVSDGLRPGHWRPAPLADYLRLVRAHDGYLIIDDTQALGVLGAEPMDRWSFGTGGGGSLRWHGIDGADVIVVSSLAKGFGVPLAALSAGAEILSRFKRDSDTRVHCSPASNPALHAAAHALVVNRQQGERRRQRLSRLVQRFRQGLTDYGLAATGGPFPVQTLASIGGASAVALQRRLWARGVRTVLHRGSTDLAPRVSWLLTARHRWREIKQAVDILAQVAPCRGAQDMAVKR